MLTTLKIQTNHQINAPADRNLLPKTCTFPPLTAVPFDGAYFIVISTCRVTLKSAVIGFTFTEGDLRILRGRRISKQLNASSTKFHLASAAWAELSRVYFFDHSYFLTFNGLPTVCSVTCISI